MSLIPELAHYCDETYVVGTFSSGEQRELLVIRDGYLRFLWSTRGFDPTTVDYEIGTTQQLELVSGRADRFVSPADKWHEWFVAFEMSMRLGAPNDVLIHNCIWERTS